jgi:DNA-binding CsgD family transcriptional regulator/tetratricopeptide (TPR) repeat protein
MQEASTAAGAHVVGREAELEMVERFVCAPDVYATLLLTGDPGVGKTTLWEAGLEAARRQGLRVLSARPSHSEAGLSFGVLADLLDGVDLASLVAVPAPQRRALETALLRAEPVEAPAEPFAIAAGLLGTLRVLSEEERILVAVDDVPCLDPPSADAVLYAARRLRGHRVRFLLARRTGDATALEQALEPGRVEHLAVGPLSVGAARSILYERLGLSLPIRIVRKIHEAAEGKPLFLLEVGRTLVGRDPPRIGEDIPVPPRVEDLLGTRIEDLARPVRKALLALALNSDLRSSQLVAVTDAATLERAVDEGLILVDHDRARPSHPLLASAALTRSKPSERRALHFELADVVGDQELRARHLALANDRPDEHLAAVIATAARAASARGACQGAAELGEYALRLTPVDSPERPKRMFDVGLTLAIAGQRQQLRELLTSELDSLPAGPARARMWLLMPALVDNNDEILEYFERALDESRSDAALHAAVLGNLSFNATAIRVEQIGEAEAWAEQALPASRADPEIERSVLYALAKARILRGRSIDDICERFRAISEATSYILGSPERLAGLRLIWRGELDRARELHSRLLALADERGDVQGYANVRTQACELELRAGEWESAARLLDEWAEPTERELMGWPAFEHCQALLGAIRGFAPEAKLSAAEELERAQAVSVPFHELEAHRVRGLAELLAHEPERAAESLRAVWEHTEREGVEEPGVLPVSPDLVEALVELGELDAAESVAKRLRTLSEEQDHPWGLATAKRCDALVRLASRYDERAADDLQQAAAEYQTLGLRLDRARSLLILGRAQRRYKKWGAARRSLEQAAVAFDEMGSPGWAEQTRDDLARVGARKPKTDGGLTPTEQRVTRLAAEGLSNKEIAAVLFVTVHTVEVHLTHAYAKLGVRSRSQLARRLSAV